MPLVDDKSLDKLVPISVTSEKLVENNKSAVKIEWQEDHSEWSSLIKKYIKQHAYEDRDMPSTYLIVNVTKSGDSHRGKWNPKFILDSEKSIQNQDREIWGVIRAEHYFLINKKEGDQAVSHNRPSNSPSAPWEKIACKIGRTGIDSLFYIEVKGKKKFAICESKCSFDDEDKFSKYKKFELDNFKTLKDTKDQSYKDTSAAAKGLRVQLQNKIKKAESETQKKMWAQQLGELNQLESDLAASSSTCITTQIIQMTRRWVIAKVNEMISITSGSGKKNKKQAREAVSKNGWLVLEAFTDPETDDNFFPVERWFNFYGTNPFYRLPGKYKVVAARKAELQAAQDLIDGLPEKEWGFPDKIEKEEFRHLDIYDPWIKKEIKKEKERQTEIEVKDQLDNLNTENRTGNDWEQ